MSKIKQLRLNNVQNIRRSIGSLARQYYRNEEGEEVNGYWWRTMCSLLKLLLEAHSQEKVTEIEKRIEKIEDLLEDPAKLTQIRNARNDK